MISPSAFLIDEFGRVVHSWTDTSYNFWGAPYLRENGNLIRMSPPGGGGGAHMVEYDWYGNKVWDWLVFDSTYYQHHDIAPLPNGNVLVLARKLHTRDEFIAAGGDTSKMTGTTLFSEMVFEVMPTGPTSGSIVWEWSIMDHLIQDFDSTKANYGVVEDHPELLDLNFGNKFENWLHGNGINYNPDLDQIILSLRLMNEFWVIDHSTTTSEAAGHSGGPRGMGGDILYRWGNPQSYRAGDSSDQQLSWQHNAQWISSGCPGEGNILTFNNGNAWNYSSIVEISPTVDMLGNYPQPSAGVPHEPASPTWIYMADPPESFYAYFISGCQRLHNGNTLMCNGPTGEIREVNPAGDIVWLYVNPIGRNGPTIQGEPTVATSVFRIKRYPFDYPAFEGRILIPGETLERYPITISGARVSPEYPSGNDSQIAIIATINADVGLSSAVAMVNSGSGYQSVEMFDDGLHMDGQAGDGQFGALLGSLAPETAVSYYIETVDDTTGVVQNPANAPAVAYQFSVGYGCGDINGIPASGIISDIADLTYLVAYLFGGGPPPPSLSAANVDGQSNGGILLDISDLTYLIDYLFKGGPAPSCGELLAYPS